MDRDQTGRGVDNQREIGLAHIAEKNLDPDGLMTEADIFTDNDQSAYGGKPRREFRQLLDLVRAGVKRRIVLVHQDRLTRTPRELEDLIDLARDGKVEIISAYSGPLDLSNSDKRMTARMLVAVAAKASDDTSRRVKDAQAAKRRKGEPLGGPRAFGWEVDARTPRESEAHTIDTALDDVLAGVSLNEIARRWNADKVPQPQTGRSNWTPDIVYRVLSNPRHAGHTAISSDTDGRPKYEPTIVKRNAFPPIVDPTKWEQVQATLRLRGARFRLPKRRSLLTGLVICAHCDRTMRRGVSNPRKGDPSGRKVWRCPDGQVTIDAGELEALIQAAAIQRLDTIDLAGMVRQANQPSQKAVSLAKEQAELEHKLEEVQDAFARHERGVTLKLVADLNARIETRIAEIARELARLSTSQVLADYVGRPGALKAAWPHLSMDQQRAIIRAALGQIRVRSARRGLPRFDEQRIELVPNTTSFD